MVVVVVAVTGSVGAAEPSGTRVVVLASGPTTGTTVASAGTGTGAVVTLWADVGAVAEANANVAKARAVGKDSRRTVRSGYRVRTPAGFVAR